MSAGTLVTAIDDRGVVVEQLGRVYRVDGLRASLAGSVLSAIDGRRTLREVLSSVAEDDVDEVLSILEQLIDANVINAAPPDNDERSLLDAGLTSDAITFLQSVAVAVVGDGPLAHDTAAALTVHSFGRVSLIPTGNDDVTNDPAGVLDRWRYSRSPPAESASGLANLTEGCRVLVSCASSVPSKAAHWVNRLAVERGQIAAFAWAAGPRGGVGPIVFPGESACFLCWRMRSLACADDFAAAMAIEEAKFDDISLALDAASPLPALSTTIASCVVLELIKVLTGIAPAELVGQVLNVEAFALQPQRDVVLAHPDCPVCRGKGLPPRLPSSGTAVDPTDPVDLDAILVGERCGVIRSLRFMPKDPFEPERPYVVRAELANLRFVDKHADAFVVCSGKGWDRTAALRSAIGEAIERYSAYSTTATPVRRARRDTLAREAIDPTRLVLFADAQYAELPYARWDEDTTIGWCDAIDLRTQETVAVPALAALLGYEFPDASEHLFAPTSNGLAAGPTCATATLAAALEVIERDAFTLGWLTQLAPTRLDVAQFDDSTIEGSVSLYARRDVSIELYQLATDVPVAIVLAIGISHRDAPAVTIGLGASLDIRHAARQAVLEVGQIRPALRHRLRSAETQERLRELVDDPTLVRDIDDHSLLFASPTMLPALAFIRDRDSTAPTNLIEAIPTEPAEQLALLTDHLARIGSTILTVDVTPPDMAALGIRTSRVIIPDFQPIHFGAHEARLGGPRLFELPTRLGRQRAAPTLRDLNQIPHPLA